MLKTTLNFTQPGLFGTPTPVFISDARNSEPPKTLNDNGFELFPHETTLDTIEFYDDEKVRTKYYPELATALQHLTGATRVVPVVHSVRNKDLNFFFDKVGVGKSNSQANRGTTANLAEFVELVHCDNSWFMGEEAMFNFLHKQDGEIMDHKTKRYQIVNVWRNIRDDPITKFNHPLACLDSSTLNLPEDCVQTVTELPKLQGHKSYHEWFWYKDMRKEEMLVFTRWDSRGTPAPDVVDSKGNVLSCHGLPGDQLGVSTFHSAFSLENPMVKYLDSYATPGRESIDTLCMLVFDL